MQEGPIIPEEQPPSEPTYIVDELVDKVFADFAESEVFTKLKEELIWHKKNLDVFFTGRLFEEIIRFKPDFWLGSEMGDRRFLSAEEVKEWYEKRNISRAQFDGLLVQSTADGERVVFFLEFSLSRLKSKWIAKHKAFLLAANLEGVDPKAQLLVLMPSSEKRIVERTKNISTIIKIHQLPFTHRQFEQLRSRYNLSLPQNV